MGAVFAYDISFLRYYQYEKEHIYDRRRTARLTAFSPEKDAFPLAAPFTERM